jgi:hypothetical protein
MTTREKLNRHFIAAALSLLGAGVWLGGCTDPASAPAAKALLVEPQRAESDAPPRQVVPPSAEDLEAAARERRRHVAKAE